MKQKTLYILLIICCLGLFSSARPNGKKCDPNACSSYCKSACAKGMRSITIKEEADTVLPPLGLLSSFNL